MAQFLVFFWIFISTTHSYILPTNEEFHNNHKLDWNSAESYCISKYNSHLLSIHDANTFQQLRTQIISINQNMNHFWIGLVNSASNNEINYTWSDSTPFNFGINIHSHTFPWFDERPESPTKDKYVRLWGGSASLLWDDTNQHHKYFWICNNNKTHIIPITNNNNNNNQAQVINNNNNTDSLDTFWKFLLFAVLTLSLCILLLRIRTIYKNYKEKHKNSSFDMGSTVITDLSFAESSNRKSRTTTNIAGPGLHFSSVDNRDDSDSIDKCNRILISPFSNSQSLLSIPQIPQIPMDNNNINYNQINLEIEHNVNQIDSFDNCDYNMSIAATFDINTYINHESGNDNDINNDNDCNGEEYMSCSTTFSDVSDETHNTYNNGRTQSCHSTMAAFDVKSFKMKSDEFKFCDIYMENININTNNIGISNGNICDDEFIVSGESSEDYESETSVQSIKEKLYMNDINISKLDNDKSQLSDKKSQLSDKKSQLSDKKMEIKANISQIMQNLKRMKNLAGNDNDNESYCESY